MPCGLGARDTLRLEVCYPLHGNDITPETDAISAGLGWVCALDKEFTGVDELRRIKDGGPERKLVAFVMEEKAIPRQGMAIAEGGEVTSGTHSPMLDAGIGMGYVPAALAQPGHGADDRRARPQPRARASSRSRSTRERSADGRRRDATRTTCGTTPSTTGRGSRATRRRSGSPGSRRTRSASSSTSSRPRRARRSTKDESYGEVESVKAVSDLISPLSGEVLEVNQKVVDAPETVNDDPYGEGWLVRIRLTDPAEADALLDAAAYKQLLAEQW